MRIKLTKTGRGPRLQQPNLDTGRKTWLLLSSDFGDGLIRVATHGSATGSGWAVRRFPAQADADLVPALLLDQTVAKVSVLLESGTGTFSVDAVTTPAAA